MLLYQRLKDFAGMELALALVDDQCRNNAAEEMPAEKPVVLAIADVPYQDSLEESIEKLLSTQRELIHSQIDELQRIVIQQCRLTGVNPLSQEMAAGALSIKIGKTPRDMLNPKAAKFLQGIFAIKDTITKREARELSALSGATIAQVREFFSAQRSRVRRFLRQLKVKSKGMNVGTTLKQRDLISTSSSICTSNSLLAVCGTEKKNGVRNITKLLNDSASCNSLVIYDELNASKDSKKLFDSEIIGEKEMLDLNFLKNFLLLMRKETTFSGQVNLLDKILKIQDQKILCWIVSKGGMPILAKWLMLAYSEEQTTVLDIIFKVLCHLPLHKAMPVQMSSILQTVNKLRFYRTQDISNRSRILLSRWSKLFGKTHSGKMIGASSKAIILSNQVHVEKGLRSQLDAKKRPNESLIGQSDSRQKILKMDFNNMNESANRQLALPSTSAASVRPLRISQNLLDNVQSSESSKRGPLQCVSLQLDQVKERRKVLLVEESPALAKRKVNTGGSASKICSRPLSIDDIQKAKRRALALQNSSDGLKLGNEDHEKIKPVNSPVLPASQHLQGDKPLYLKDKKESKASEISVQALCYNEREWMLDLETRRSSFQGSLSIEHICHQEAKIAWTKPPEVYIDPNWMIGYGQESKEVGFQLERVKRETEAVYTNESIPSYPKEPWDIELDYDDSLTPLIPLVSVSGESPMQTSLSYSNGDDTKAVVVGSRIETSDSAGCHSVGVPFVDDNLNSVGIVSEQNHLNANNDSAPDLELLALLLKNPELVIALTSQQGTQFSKEQTGALLDILKTRTDTGSTNAEETQIDQQSSDNASPTSILQSMKGLADLISTYAAQSSNEKLGSTPPVSCRIENVQSHANVQVLNMVSEENGNADVSNLMLAGNQDLGGHGQPALYGVGSTEGNKYVHLPNGVSERNQNVGENGQVEHLQSNGNPRVSNLVLERNENAHVSNMVLDGNPNIRNNVHNLGSNFPPESVNNQDRLRHERPEMTHGGQSICPQQNVFKPQVTPPTFKRPTSPELSPWPVVPVPNGIEDNTMANSSAIRDPYPVSRHGPYEEIRGHFSSAGTSQPNQGMQQMDHSLMPANRSVHQNDNSLMLPGPMQQHGINVKPVACFLPNTPMADPAQLLPANNMDNFDQGAFYARDDRPNSCYGQPELLQGGLKPGYRPIDRRLDRSRNLVMDFGKDHGRDTMGYDYYYASSYDKSVVAVPGIGQPNPNQPNYPNEIMPLPPPYMNVEMAHHHQRWDSQPNYPNDVMPHPSMNVEPNYPNERMPPPYVNVERANTNYSSRDRSRMGTARSHWQKSESRSNHHLQNASRTSRSNTPYHNHHNKHYTERSRPWASRDAPSRHRR